MLKIKTRRLGKTIHLVQCNYQEPNIPEEEKEYQIFGKGQIGTKEEFDKMYPRKEKLYFTHPEYDEFMRGKIRK